MALYFHSYSRYPQKNLRNNLELRNNHDAVKFAHPHNLLKTKIAASQRLAAIYKLVVRKCYLKMSARVLFSSSPLKSLPTTLPSGSSRKLAGTDFTP